MIKITALNDSSLESCNDDDAGPSLEALEAAATRIYRNAITHLAKKDPVSAKSCFLEALANPFIEKATWKECQERPKSLPQDIALKYSCYKNLGNIHMSEQQYEEACNYYIKAVHLDGSEVSLWQKLGAAAIKIKDFQLALEAFQEGLLINPLHWPCADQLLSILFLFGLYEDCLGLIIQTLNRDPGYVKALAFRDKIFEFQPSLKSFTKEFYRGSDVLDKVVDYDRKKGEAFVATCLSLKPPLKEPTPPAAISSKKLVKSVSKLAWQDLADALTATYDDALSTDDIKVITERIQIEDVLNDVILEKTKSQAGKNLAQRFLGTLKPGRRISRSLSQSDRTSDTLPEIEDQSGKISSRRQTIELGEYQNSFKIGLRKSTEEAESINSIEKPKLLCVIPEEEEASNKVCEVAKVEEAQMEEAKPKDSTQDDESKMTTLASKPIEKELEKDSVPSTFNQEQKIEPMEVNPPQGAPRPTKSDEMLEIPSTMAESKEEEVPPCEKIETDQEAPVEDFAKSASAVRTEAAINQLQDIMSLKPSSGILGLPLPEFESDYPEDCDNPYEDQDLPLGIKGTKPPTEGLISFTEENLELFSRQTNLDLLPQHFLLSQEAETKVHKATKRIKINPSSILEKKQMESETEKDSSQSSQEKDQTEYPNVATSTRQPQINPQLAGSDMDSPAAVKKPKRQKRGLERELEQLDYWGRRKAREAKRRRRTLTSKLVGAFEESEYLTWAHLLRSFIPAGLLSEGEVDSSVTSTLKKQPLNTDALGEVVPNQPTDSDGQRSKDATTNPSTELIAENQNGRLTQSSLELPYPHLYKYLKETNDAWSSEQWSQEELQVANFICGLRENGGTFHVLQHLQFRFIDLYNKKWSLACATTYIEIYRRVRPLVNFGSFVSATKDPHEIWKMANAALTFIELSISIWSANSSSRDEEKSLTPDDMSQIEDDLFELNLLLERPDVWREEYLQTYLRICWIHAQLKIIHGSPYEAVAQLQVLMEEMKLAMKEGEEDSFAINLCRITEDNSTISISIKEITNQLNFLQRSQMLEQVEPKYNAQCYSEVIEILTCMFHKGAQGSSCETPSTPRHLQLLILADSLSKVKDYKGLIEWGAYCLAEASETFQNLDSDNTPEKDKWEETIRTLLTHLHEAYLSEEFMITKVKKGPVLSKLLQALVEILVLQLESNSEASFPCFRTLSSWVLFYHILSQYERQQEKKAARESPSAHTPPEEEGVEKAQTATPFPSTLFLITAQEELGKNGWCALEDGTLLLLTMDVLIQELSRPVSDEQKVILHEALEQVIFCLYSHPSRKNKYKHLKDHGVHQIALTWKRALQLYNYYVPAQLPDFQSSQIPSISDDISLLFKRILVLAPEECNLDDHLRVVEDLLERDISYEPFPFHPELVDCHYLLADFYFKNKNWDLAIYHYKLDVSLNPGRLISWAPMGLAIKAKLETLLNSCDIIDNLDHFFKQAHTSRKCLEKALLIDQYYCNLWVEKGGLVYMIHSHASRLLKQDLDPDMSIERFETLERIKKDSLKEAERCFHQAYQIVEEGWDDDSLPDERWLYQYMLGKVAEKDGKPLQEVISHYLKASNHLHEIGAKYPLKISYSNPQDNAIEAMEMFFRIICIILKKIRLKEDKGITVALANYFKETLDTLFASPFAKCQEQRRIAKLSSWNGCTVKPKDKTNQPETNELKDFCQTLSDKLLKDSLSNCFKIIEDKRANSEEKLTEDGKELAVGDKKFAQKDEIQCLIHRCLEGLKLCIARFPHHYKSLYRLSYHYHNSKDDYKDNHKARNYIMGCDFWQRLEYMPVNGLFHERKIWTQNPKICNFFHGIWRIPHDEIDRPGSFAAHMYKCVCLCLDILQEMRDFYTVFEIALSLKNSPDKDRKYLRDNERELLSEHASQVGLQTMKDKYRFLFKSSSPVNSGRQHSFLMDVYRAYKNISRHLLNLDSQLAKMLTESYSLYKGKGEVGTNLLKEAELFCMKAPFPQQTGTPGFAPRGLSPVGTPTTSFGTNRRGRPPGQTRMRGTFLPKEPPVTPTGDSIAVQQAYKVYENLIQAQTMLNSKSLDPKNFSHYQKKHEQYKQQMLNYLQIPSVSRYFHTSLQSLGTSAAKLPPPPPLDSNSDSPLHASNSSQSSSISSDKQSFGSLAPRSLSHAVSISTVSKKSTSVPLKAVKPSMSITVSQVPKGSTSATKQDSSSLSGQVCIKDSDSKVDESGNNLISHLKLPQGTTLSLQTSTSDTKQSVKEECKPVQISKVLKNSSDLESKDPLLNESGTKTALNPLKKASNTTESSTKNATSTGKSGPSSADTSKNKPPSSSTDPLPKNPPFADNEHSAPKHSSNNAESLISPSTSSGSSDNKAKHHSSFQAAFQASISSTDLITAVPIKRQNKDDSESESKRQCLSSEVGSEKDQSASLKTAKHPKPIIPRDPLDLEADEREEDIIVLD